jgi:hypothetical protein
MEHPVPSAAAGFVERLQFWILNQLRRRVSTDAIESYGRQALTRNLAQVLVWMIP